MLRLRYDHVHRGLREKMSACSTTCARHTMVVHVGYMARTYTTPYCEISMWHVTLLERLARGKAYLGHARTSSIATMPLGANRPF